MIVALIMVAMFADNNLEIGAVGKVYFVAYRLFILAPG
jgi:hypothetical protein